MSFFKNCTFKNIYMYSSSLLSFISIYQSNLSLINSSFSDIFLNGSNLISYNQPNDNILMDNIRFYNITQICMETGLIVFINSEYNLTLNSAIFTYIQSSNT